MKKNAEKLTLQATKREEFGKKLRKLRHSGRIPANIYGPDFKSVAVTVNVRDFTHAFKVARETGVVYIQVDKEEIPTLIKDIQRHPVSNMILHVDFRKINLNVKIETDVPIVFVNDSPAVAQLGGQLLTQANEILIEALPTDIPENIEIDLAKLTEIGSEVRVKDIPAIPNVTIKEDEDRMIVSVVARKEESITPETQAEAPEITTEKKGDEEGGEGEAAPAEEASEEKGEDKEKDK